MAEKPLWSVVVIAKDEAKTLPRLVESLREFQKRGGDVIVLDTGSKDDTVAQATALGCEVHTYPGFSYTVSADEADEIAAEFQHGDDGPIVRAGDIVFDFSAAREFAANISRTDMIAMPDCDEVYTALDIDAINAMIRNGAQQFQYPFVYAHFPDGKPWIQFTHSKFYDRRVLKWTGIVHEVLTGNAKCMDVPESIIKLEHWQNPHGGRAKYLTGLAYDCMVNPDNDRNAHYFARELMYTGRFKSAVAAFRRHIDMNKWVMERAQSMVYLGDCFRALGHIDDALMWWHKAFQTDPSRRAGLMALAKHYYTRHDPQRAAAYAAAALTIPLNSYYGNDMADYTYFPHEILYWAYWCLRNQTESRKHWEICRQMQPCNSKFLGAAQFYMDLPKVSIIIPTLDRPQQLEHCIDLIRKNANYPDYEIITVQSTWENPQTCPIKFAHGVKQATGKLIMFLGDDAEPQPDFLIQAVLRFKEAFDSWDAPGLVGLNDNFWRDRLATHWLASLSLLPYLGGEYMHTGYFHVGADNELTARCKRMHRFAFAEKSLVIHKTAPQGTAPQDRTYEYGWSHAEEDRKLLTERAKRLDFEVI